MPRVFKISMRTKKILYNTGAQLAGRMASGFLAFLQTLLFARILGGEKYGELIKITSYLAFFYICVDFGLNAVYLRAIGNQVVRKLKSLIILRVVMSLGITLIAIVGMWGLSLTNNGFSPVVVQGVVVGSLSIGVYAIWLSANAAFQKFLKYDWAALAQICGSLTTLILLFFLNQSISLQQNFSILFCVLALVIGNLIMLGVALLYLRGYLRQSYGWIDSHMWRKLLRASWPLGLTLLFNVVYFRVDLLILTAQRTSLEVGAYGLAYKFFETALILPAFFMNSVYPELLVETSKEKILALMKNICFYLLIIGMVIGAGMWLLAPALVLVKSDFQASVPLLKLLSISLPIFFLTSPFMWLFILFKKQNLLVLIYLTSMIFNVLANLVFIPQYGAVSAAISTGVTEVLVLIMGYWLVRKNFYVTKV